MTATPASDLAGLVQQELERERQQRFSELGDDPLAWLAFVPLWTDRVARASRFPEQPLPLAEFPARADAAGWCVRKVEPGPRTPYLRLEVAVDLLPHAYPSEGRSGPHREAIEKEVVAIPDEAVRAPLTARLVGSPPQPARSPERARSPVEEAGSLDDADPVRAARALREVAGELPEREVSIRADHLFWKLASTPAAPRAVALGDVAAALARKKLTDQTLRVAERIEDTRVRAAALGELVAALGRTAGRSRPMLDTVVEQCWRTATGAHGSLDPTVAAGFASQLAAARRDGDVRRLAMDALAVAEHALPTPAVVGAMQRIGDALDAVDRQRRPFDPRFLNVVLRLASGIGDPVARAAALASTVAWMRRYEPPPEVYGPVSSSGLLAAARAIEHGEDRVRALARVVPLLPRDLRRQVADEALALAGQVEEAAGAVTFWMPDTARAAVIEELRRRHDFSWLQSTAGHIGASIQEAARSVAVPAPLARWAELAVAALPSTRQSPAQQLLAQPTPSSKSAAAHLDRRITELLAAGDTGQALTWLDTARSLSPLLLGEFEVSVLANTRRVELVHRRWLDRRRLERFLPRADPLRAFDELLDHPDGPGGAWALHYLGVGGVGKTMLIRHLTTELAPARDALTSRIDFDHLNPDFPRRRPAQLVVELAAELETQAQDTRLIGLYRQAYEALQEVNARAQPVSLEDEDFAKGLRTFAGFLQALGRRVVLILDTCEELEKFRPAGGRLEQLEATFKVLEALHRQVPTLRVVLAGRRPLARSGRGWRLADLAGRRHALLPESKPYLLLHEVRGFDRAEAEEFLTRRAGLRPDAPEELIVAILERCPDPGSAAEVDWDDGHRPPQAPRYNPFDLDLIAGWVRTEPHMTVAELRASRSDLYVETRIVGRLNNPGLERLLPAVVALGRFEHEMLLPAFDLGEQALADAERELAAAEWIDVQRDEALETTFLEVDRNLRPRLEAYFRREHPGLLRQAARRLAPCLSRLVGDPERPLSRLGFDHVDAALRLLPPAEAARVVDRLAMRVVEEAAAQEGAWGWAATVAERLLAEGSPLAEPDHPAGPGLRAMLASALRHLDPQRDLSELWAAVEQSASNHPDPETAEWLAQRAYLQLLVAASGTDTLERLLASLRVPPSSARSGGPSQAEVRRQVLIGGMLSALQDLLDLAEADSRPARLPGSKVAYHAVYLAVADPAAETENPAADAFRRMLLGRAALLQGQLGEARAAFDEAVNRLVDDELALTPWLRADWEPPQDLPARIRLEWIRARLLAGAGDTAVTADEAYVVSRRFGKPVAEAAVRLGAIDAERFASAALDARLAHEVVPAEVLELYERAADLYDQRRPVCEAHRAVPPLFVALAHGWAALGRARRALAVLQRGHVAAVEQRHAAIVTAAASAQMEVVRRFRLVDEYRSRRQQLLYSAERADRQRVWPVLALVDPVEPSQPPWRGDQHAPPSPSASPADWHAWWRVQSAAAGLDRAIELMTRRHRGWEPEPRSFTGLSLALDMAEVREIQSLPSPAVSVHTVPWAAEHPLEAEHAVCLELRQLALFDAAHDLERWVALLGPRRVAELALDEGEMLGLRLPDRAQRLFSYAAKLFSQAKDPVGGFIARVLVALTFEEGDSGAAVAVSGLKTAYEQLPPDPEGEPLLPWPGLLALGRTRRRFDHPDWGGWAPRLLVAFARLNGAIQAEALSLADDLGLHSAELPGLLGVRSDLPSSHTGEFEAVPPPRTPPTEAFRTTPPPASSERSSPRPAASPEAVLRQAAAERRQREPDDATFGPTAPVEVPGALPREWDSYPSARAPAIRAPWRWPWLLAGMLVMLTALAATAFFVVDRASRTSQVTPTTATAPPTSGDTTSTTTRGVPSTTGLKVGAPPEGGGVPWGLISVLVTVVTAVATILVALLNPRQRRTHASERRVETPQPPRRARAPGTAARLLRPLLPTRANLGTLAIRPAAVLDDSARFELLGVRAWSGGRPGFGPYRHQLGLVPESLPTRVALRVAPELAKLPWEAFVLPATRPSLWARRACWRELRLLPATRQTPTKPSWWRRRHGHVGVLASASWLPLLEGSLSNIDVLGQGERRSERPHTLVTVGTPVQTSSGIRFQLEVEETERQIFVARSIDPDAAALYDHQLVVVVGHPGDAYARVDAERETTADLRQCAADVAAAGAGSVLCLPSMPADLAARVLAELDRRLWQVERRGWSALVAATESLRKLIETSLPDSDERREVARELALEVTVFVRTDRAT